MFEKLNSSEKIMYFNDERIPLAYPKALKELAEKVGRSNLLPQELEDIIINSLKNVAIQLNLGAQPNSEDYSIVVAFYEWVQSIHNKSLIPPEGAAYPNNIIYDMLASLRDLRKKELLNPETVLLHFFLEGANGRKISGGDTPNPEFIATTLELEVINTVKGLTGGSLSKTASQFVEKYESLKNYINPQKNLENALTQLKNNNELYGVLSGRNVFTFKREKNLITEANRYLIDQAVEMGLNALKEINDDKLPNKVKDMVESIKNIYPNLLFDLENARQSSTPEAHALAMWDASEWITRLYAALSIAVNYDSQHKTVFDEFMHNPLVAEILSRSQAGDFPAKERNEILMAVEITELFTQNQFAKAREATITTEQSAPVYGSVWNVPPKPPATTEPISSLQETKTLNYN